jgi:hypothetical protein
MSCLILHVEQQGGTDMADARQNPGEAERPESRPRKPREELGDQLKRIRDEAVGDLKKSLGMPREDAGRARPSGYSPSLSGASGQETAARASETAGPGAPRTGQIKVTGEALIRHREKRMGPNYAPADETEALMDAKDAGQYHVTATAAGMSESAHGANELDKIRKIYHELGEQARKAGDPREEVSQYYPRGDPSRVEKGMVDQTARGMKIIKEAYKDGYTGRPLKPTSEMLQEQQGGRPGTKRSGIVGGLLNRLRGSSSPVATPTTVTGVRGSQTDSPEAAGARKLLRDGYLRDEDLGEAVGLLDSSDPSALERLKPIVAKYREEGISLL